MYIAPNSEGQILPFPIDFDGRPYNTVTLLYCVSVWYVTSARRYAIVNHETTDVNKD